MILLLSGTSEGRALGARLRAVGAPFVASVTCLSVHVSPPSVERATTSGVGKAFPPLTLRNDAQHV